MRKLSLLVALAAFVCVPLAAQGRSTVPADVQLAVFTKIWTLDRGFHPPEELTVGILYQRLVRESLVAKDELIRAAATRPGIRLVPIDADTMDPSEPVFAGLDVLYVAPLRAVDLEAVLSRTRALKIRTVTGVTDYVALGVAVGVDRQRDRAVIVVNLGAARAEGAEFSSQLLKLARVIE